MPLRRVTGFAVLAAALCNLLNAIASNGGITVTPIERVIVERAAGGSR